MGKPANSRSLILVQWLKDLWKETSARYAVLIGFTGNVITFLLPGLHSITLRAIAVGLLIVGFVWANFRVYRRLRSDLADMSKALNNKISQITKLKIKPYDETQLETVGEKLKNTNCTERDLLRFLLQRGETEGNLISLASQVSQAEWIPAVEKLTQRGLLLMREDTSQRPAYLPRFWRVNPAFEAVLQDLLYPRNEAQETVRFLV